MTISLTSIHLMQTMPEQNMQHIQNKHSPSQKMKMTRSARLDGYDDQPPPSSFRLLIPYSFCANSIKSDPNSTIGKQFLFITPVYLITWSPDYLILCSLSFSRTIFVFFSIRGTNTNFSSCTSNPSGTSGASDTSETTNTPLVVYVF